MRSISNKHDKFQDSPFSYRKGREEKVFIFWYGRSIMTLKGKKAMSFLERVSKLNDTEQQLVMAKITGNFKRGNEQWICWPVSWRCGCRRKTSGCFNSRCHQQKQGYQVPQIVPVFKNNHNRPYLVFIGPSMVPREWPKTWNGLKTLYLRMEA